MTSSRVRVLSIPSRHPYVDAIQDLRAVETVAEDPEARQSAESSWQPSAALEQGWILQNAHRFDVVHVHFGFESRTSEQLLAFCREIRATGRGLVLTVHDLSNPQLEERDQPSYAEGLGCLVEAADHVFTLTASAAQEIWERWGRRAVVVEHPPLVPEEDLALAREQAQSRRRAQTAPRDLTGSRDLAGQGAEGPGAESSPAPRLGVLLKDARPSLDLEAVAVLADVLEQHPGLGTLEVLHHGRFRAGREAEVARLLHILEESPAARAVPTERLDDAALHAWLMDLDVLVLPYGHGTHSGLLELAHDLGTRVLVSDRGHFGGQSGGAAAVVDLHDPDAVREALDGLLRSPAPAPMTRAESWRRLEAARAEHTAVYRRVLRARGREQDGDRLGIVVLSAFRYPLVQPHSGGLESHVWTLVQSLRERGHRVLLAAPEGSDFQEEAPEELVLPRFAWPEDVPFTEEFLPPQVERLQHAALERVRGWLAEHSGQIDVVHHHGLSAVPHRWGTGMPVPMVTTLHTPPLEPVVRALAGAPQSPGERAPELVSVSEHTAGAWRARGVDSRTVRNGVDTAAWTLGTGGTGEEPAQLCWFGRIVPEKAPHLAVRTARALGAPLVLAGPVGDPEYARAVLFPLMERTRERTGVRCEWIGALRQPELADLVGASRCTLVTPQWEEPFGQVVAESLACGTPVVALRRGGLGEVYAQADGVRLVPASRFEGLVVARLARAVRLVLTEHQDPAQRARLRGLAREEAVTSYSFERTVDALERIYRERIGSARGRKEEA